MQKFSIGQLSEELKKCKNIDFAYIFGSSQKGIINDGSDVDIAVYLNKKYSLEIYSEISSIVEKVTNNEKCDLSILNTSSSILGMEALQGKLLFYKKTKKEEYVNFYSYTCRNYEDEMFEIEQNLKYRGY